MSDIVIKCLEDGLRKIEKEIVEFEKLSKTHELELFDIQQETITKCKGTKDPTECINLIDEAKERMLPLEKLVRKRDKIGTIAIYDKISDLRIKATELSDRINIEKFKNKREMM